MAFLLGWVGMLMGGAAITWLANPALFISWVFFAKRPKWSLVASFAASFISLCFLMFGQVLANESGQYQQITSYHAGYWLWLASCVTMLVGNIYFQRQARLSGTMYS